MIETAAIVLHAFDYRETSRIVRLATRELGVVSAIARGARRPKSRFGQGLDLFTEGTAQLVMHRSADLHTLVAFDAGRLRGSLAASLGRFGAATALAEVCLRFGTEAGPGAFDALSDGLDQLGLVEEAAVTATALATAWRIVAELGFAPALDSCALCHRALSPDEETRFSHRGGGAVCGGCRSLAPAARTLPAAARATLLRWLAGQDDAIPDTQTARAHQRLLREFLEEHLGEARGFIAFAAWERRSP